MINKITIILALMIVMGMLLAASAIAGESADDLLQDISDHSGEDKVLKGPSKNPNKQIDTRPSSAKTQPGSDVPSPSGEGPLESEKILKPFRPDQSIGKSDRGAKPTPVRSTVTLGSLEKEFRAAPDVLVAVAELEESLSLLEQKQARSGLKVFGGAGVGAYREPVTDKLVRDYQRANVKLGLRYPLLGSLQQERIDILKTEAKAREKEHEIEFINHKSLGVLRTFYISYWGSQRKFDLSRAFLENEPEVEKVLEHRTRAGYLLDADRQEFLSAFALVRRNIANLETSRNRALNVLRLMTKPGLEIFKPATPQLPDPCGDLDKLKTVVMETHPEINLLRKQVENQLGMQHAARHADIEADVTLAGTATSDLPDEQTGYGVAVNFNVQIPAKIKQAKAAREKVNQATLKKIQRQLDLRSATLLQEAEEAQYRFRAAYENVDFATQRLKAGMEGVRENLLRSAYLEGDTIEKLQQSRYNYYQSAIDYIDAETNKMQAQAKLLQFSSDGCQPKKAHLAIKKASHQPIDSEKRSTIDRKPVTNRLPSVLDATRTSPRHRELPPEKRADPDRPKHSDLQLRDIVFAGKRHLPQVPKPETSPMPPADLNESNPCISNCYTVQLGAYKHLSGAKTFTRGFENVSHDIVIRTVNLPGKGRMYRVHMGAFTDDAGAKRLAQHLVETYGRQAFVVHLNK